MKIRIVGHEGQPVFPFGEIGPWREFANVFYKHGHEIVMDNFGAKIDVLVANRHSAQAFKEADSNSVGKKNRFMIMWEPSIVDESAYRKRVFKSYGLTFAPSNIWASRVNGQSFHWPQRYFRVELNMQSLSQNIGKCVLMQGNKFSARSGEMYSFRRRIINLCNKNGIKLDLYGPNWNKGFVHDLRRWIASAFRTRNSLISMKSLYGMGQKHPNYMGIAMDKSEVLQKYDISIVIENSLDYVSEKLFDAVQAETIVIYVGPDLETFGIRSENFLTSNANPLEVIALIELTSNLSIYDKKEILSKQNAELQRIKSEWESTAVLTNIAEEIVKLIS